MNRRNFLGLLTLPLVAKALPSERGIPVIRTSINPVFKSSEGIVFSVLKPTEMFWHKFPCSRAGESLTLAAIAQAKEKIILQNQTSAFLAFSRRHAYENLANSTK